MRKSITSLLIIASVSLPVMGAEQEFVVRNEAASVVLCGTLQTPDNVAPKALVVMASGSGQQNRDEEIFGHKIFKDIADRLSCSGYASLRLDDRGTGSSSGDFSKATNDDFTDDIACALKSANSVFTDIPIGVLGHSEGGSVAIRLGAHNPLCEFIITLAAPAWRGDSIIMSQARALAENASGNWSAENATLQRRLLDICLSPIPSALARPVFISTMTKGAGSAGTLPQVQASIAASADAMLSEWYRGFLRYDPSDDISSVRVPWLALNGDRDRQVVPENLETIRHLNPGASVRLIPMHNHLFQKCTTGSPAEYARITESISGETLAAIVEWLDTNIVEK